MAYPQHNNNPAGNQHSNPLINMIQMNTIVFTIVELVNEIQQMNSELINLAVPSAATMDNGTASLTDLFVN